MNHGTVGIISTNFEFTQGKLCIWLRTNENEHWCLSEYCQNRTLKIAEEDSKYVIRNTHDMYYNNCKIVVIHEIEARRDNICVLKRDYETSDENAR